MNLRKMVYWAISTFLFSNITEGSVAQADERHFGYAYEADVLPKGQWEFEQSITNQNGKEDGDYTEWNLRSEFEYGINEHLMTALYLNLDSVRSEGVTGEEDSDEATFEGVSSEWIYQLTNPQLDPVGSALYAEISTDGVDAELEGKIILSKETKDFLFAFNAIYEAEWDREDNRTEKEAELEFTAGVGYKFDPHWSSGIEVRNKADYPDGLNLDGQEFQSWSVGPNIHYGDQKWWANFTVLPQVWGNGDGSEGNRNLVHEEAIEFRLLFGVLF
jgi:hypothetical protein